MDNTRLTKEYETYRLYLKSYDIEIQEAADFNTVAKKNFEMLRQTIALRVMPETIRPLRRVRSLKDYGSDKFNAMGYVWEFAVESLDAFYDKGDKVGLLIKELNGIVLHCGGVLVTTGEGCNIEFKQGPFEPLTYGDNDV